MSFPLNRTDIRAIHSVPQSTLTEQPTAGSVPAVNTDIGRWFDWAPKAATLDLSTSLVELPALGEYYR